MTYHLRLKNKKRFFTIIICFIFMIVIFATVLSVSASSSVIEKTKLIVVQTGDTLWGIAEEHCPEGDIRKYIYQVKLLNGMETSTIYAGQGLFLPIE